MFRARAVVVLCLPLVLAGASLGSQTNIIGAVQRVIDGDTIVVFGVGTVRLIGVDTPETVHPSKPVEHFGREATEFTRRLAEGRSVRLEFEARAPIGTTAPSRTSTWPTTRS